ncbi:hypothetical protein F2Q69_00049709 [Brassica cretica]|uniref:Putative plant transposon protein domain-containing protein n=1 Tax=Brassica cretica TaxID=69181 RepID=A0A8S9PWU8_BRACR|nr:hypothetical protein F2Q69_00049709 [Brassica cretica]
MSMNKSTSTAGKASKPPLLSLVDYSDDEEQTTPQESQTSQSRSDVFGTATENLYTESDTESDPAEPHIKDEQMTEKSDHAEPIIESTQVKMTAGNESEEGDESEKTESEGVEEIDVEDVELLINIKKKAKSKKRKAPSSIQRNNPLRKTTRKSTPSVTETQTSTPPTVVEGSSTRATRKSVNAELVVEHRYESFSSREIIPEKSVDLDAEDTWGFLDIIKKSHLERTVKDLVGYIPEIVKEFYAALPGEITRASKDRVELTVRGHKFEFSPTKINEHLNLVPLSEEKAALVILSAYNWVPSSHKNVVSADRARLIYKMFHGIRVDVEEMFYAHILNLARKPREKLSPVIPYKKDSRLGEIYLKNQKEEREAAKKTQRQAKKKGKFASTSTAAPLSGSPPQALLTPKELIRPGQPIDAEEAKLALDTTSAAIRQLATAMQTPTSVVRQIASMLFPRGEADDPQQQDD